jgi:hypothetical protein
MAGENFREQIVKVADAAAQEATVTIHTQSSIAMIDDFDCEA